MSIQEKVAADLKDALGVANIVAHMGGRDRELGSPKLKYIVAFQEKFGPERCIFMGTDTEVVATLDELAHMIYYCSQGYEAAFTDVEEVYDLCTSSELMEVLKDVLGFFAGMDIGALTSIGSSDTGDSPSENSENSESPSSTGI